MTGDGSFSEERLGVGLIKVPEPAVIKGSGTSSRKTRELERMGAGTGRHSIYEGLARVHTNLTNLRDMSLPENIDVEDALGDEEEEEDYGPHSVVDRCFEHQRGCFIFGFPFFSANSLMPLVDPKPYTTDKGVMVTGGASSYLLPDVSWKWSWKRWYVDMSLDVDDQGWAYSWRFGSKSWHGVHVWLQSFVRRRQWIRKREKIPCEDTKILFKHGEGAIPFDVRPALSSRAPSSSMWIKTMDTSEIHTVSQLELALQDARLDRERIAILVNFMHDERNMHALWSIANDENDKYIATILDSFKYADSKSHLITHLQKPYSFSDPEHEEVYRLLVDNFQDFINQTGYYNPNLFILENT